MERLIEFPYGLFYVPVLDGFLRDPIVRTFLDVFVFVKTDVLVPVLLSVNVDVDVAILSRPLARHRIPAPLCSISPLLVTRIRRDRATTVMSTTVDILLIWKYHVSLFWCI